MFPLSLSKLPLKQLTDLAETNSSGKEFHKLTIPYSRTLAPKSVPCFLFFKLHTVASSYWSSRFVFRQDLRAVAVLNSLQMFEDFYDVTTCTSIHKRWKIHLFQSVHILLLCQSILVALCWTLSSIWMSFCRKGCHTTSPCILQMQLSLLTLQTGVSWADNLCMWRTSELIDYLFNTSSTN